MLFSLTSSLLLDSHSKQYAYTPLFWYHYSYQFDKHFVFYIVLYIYILNLYAVLLV